VHTILVCSQQPKKAHINRYLGILLLSYVTATKIDSDFYPLWESKMRISFQDE